MTGDYEKIEAIMGVTAEMYHVSQTALMSRDRTSHIAWARQITAYAVREFTGMSWQRIANVLDRHHSTIVHCHHVVERASNNGKAGDVKKYMRACEQAVGHATLQAGLMSGNPSRFEQALRALLELPVA